MTIIHFSSIYISDIIDSYILYTLHLCYRFITEHLAIYILFEFFVNAFLLRKCINTNWKLCVVGLHTIEIHWIRQYTSKLPTIKLETKLPEVIRVATSHYKQL